MKRFVCALAAATVVATTYVPTSLAQGSGGKNVVMVNNTTDGRTAARSGVQVGRASGELVNPENLARATSSCADCRTNAVAIQAVIILTDQADSVKPNNAAVAVNSGCRGCRTFAYAYQYVVTIGEPGALTPEGESAVVAIRSEAAEAAQSDLDFPALESRLDELAQRLRSVIDEEIVRPLDGQGTPRRDVQTRASPADC